MCGLPPRILIVGASTRAAAQSAVRCGIQPVCLAQFVDTDLLAVADVLTSCTYPSGVAESARSVPVCPWMYTGAIENRPQLVSEVSASRPLLGNPANVLRAVRDPREVSRALKEAELPALAVRPADAAPPADGRWLIKPRRSSGGEGIHVWDRHFASQNHSIGSVYFQERIDGDSLSALFLAGSRKAWLVGVCRQLIGAPSSHASGFSYCGSIGPLLPGSQTEERIHSDIRRIGTTLAERFGLRGLFGCDFVCDGDTAWLTEVNPRYTASTEIYELAYDEPLLPLHCRACEDAVPNFGCEIAGRPVLPRFCISPSQAPLRYVGKQVVYARSDLTTPDLESFVRRESEVPFIADVPSAGTRILKGRPVCTVFGAADTLDRCCEQLAARVRELSIFLWPEDATYSENS